MASFKEYLAYTEEKGYLSSDFTFGFELEGWMKNIEALDRLEDLAEHLLGECDWTDDESITPSEITCPTCHDHNRFCNDCNGRGSVKDRIPKTFEMNSPVFKCTPENYAKVIRFLRQAKKIGLRVNASCSFHTHFGFPDAFSRSEDIFWLMVKIALNSPSTLDKLKKMDDIQFESIVYASTEIFQNISSAIKTFAITGDVYALKQCYTDKKFVMLRQHPQGTLEWRGPRNFIQQEDDKYITDFFKQLSSLLIDFSNLLNTSSASFKFKSKEYIVTKEEIFEVLASSKSPGVPVTNRKKDIRFEVAQNTKVIDHYMKKYPFLTKGKFKHAIFSDTREEMNSAYWESGEYHTLEAYDCFFEGGSIANCKIENSYIDADVVKVGDNVKIVNCSVQYKEENHYNVHGDLKQELADWED